jgi:hypothetical protein
MWKTFSNFKISFFGSFRLLTRSVSAGSTLPTIIRPTKAWVEKSPSDRDPVQDIEIFIFYYAGTENSFAIEILIMLALKSRIPLKS